MALQSWLDNQFQVGPQPWASECHPVYFLPRPLSWWAMAFYPLPQTEPALSGNKVNGLGSEPWPGNTPVSLIKLWGGDWSSPGKNTTHTHCCHWKLDHFCKNKCFLFCDWFLPLVDFQCPDLVNFDNFVQFYTLFLIERSCLHLYPPSLEVPPASHVLKLCHQAHTQLLSS